MTETLVGMPPSRGSKSKPGLEAALAAASPAVPAGSQGPGVDLAVAGLLARPPAGPGDGPLPDDGLELARELVRQARDAGVDLTGPGGLLKSLTKLVIETALEEEMSEHLGYDKNAVQGRNRGNSRNGKRSKTVLTDAAGAVEIEVPRDRDGTFEPVIVGKRQRRLSDVDTVVISLASRGLTTGEISAHFAEVYGASVSKDTITRITDKVLEEMATWWSRPLERGRFPANEANPDGKDARCLAGHGTSQIR